MVLHAHDGCGKVDDAEALVDDILNTDGVELLRVRIRLRVGIVYTVDGLRKEDLLAVQLDSTEYDAGVGREVRVAGATGTEDNRALLHRLDRLILIKQLGHVADLDRRHHLRLHALCPENLGNIDAVHHGREDADLICLITIDLHRLAATPEVTAADHDGQLYAGVDRGLHFLCDGTDRIIIKAEMLLTCQCFTGQLQHDSSILLCHSISFSQCARAYGNDADHDPPQASI